MKKLTILFLLLIPSLAIVAQPIFDLGVKAGINNSKVTFKKSEFNSESIVKTHIGAFARLGYNRIYIQPEAYFSAKGGAVLAPGSDLSERAAKFDFNNIDVPILLGVKVLKGGMANLRIMGGPVFSFVTDKGFDAPDDDFLKEYVKDHYFGYQYGVGVDVWHFSLDARMEHGANDIYSYPNGDINGKNQTFLVTLGFKIL
ncbi:Outer membrane protein beta-barrel domain-containing protein [Mariniphaga anaerophila]|uniref:Outer membrane protein beta-barrel domain-containing protein n=1 Tax=Mariniphaga anaerophila TaxID=1484053 RepID=A0A1M4TIX2_9BACT|nr:porin family protein [Mariniphaga anaerophila]SHE44449.1 Outer membrane protein beta-barrel domain-containing protein [Mariniphaga anaerophila]